jgi:translation initiation factor IF-2
MNDHNGNRVDEAGPSTPVEITGVTGIPQAGDDFFVVDSEIQARQIAELRGEKIAHLERGVGGPISLEEFARRASSTAAAELNLIIKADVHGSLEAVRSAVDQLSTDKVKVKVIHAAIGGVNESDVQLAVASKAVVIGFGVRGEPRAMADAERFSIDVRFYRIIYDLIDEVKKAMAGLLEPIKHEVFLGRAEVRETFVVPRQGTVAGSFVTDGLIKRGCLARVLRDSRVIFEGKLGSLRRFKDDVKEVQRGFECGIGVENFNDVKVGDTLEAYQIEERPATL